MFIEGTEMLDEITGPTISQAITEGWIFEPNAVVARRCGVPNPATVRRAIAGIGVTSSAPRKTTMPPCAAKMLATIGVMI